MSALQNAVPPLTQFSATTRDPLHATTATPHFVLLLLPSFPSSKFYSHLGITIMAVRAQFENSNEYVRTTSLKCMQYANMSCVESVSSQHSQTHMRLSQSELQRTSTGATSSGLRHPRASSDKVRNIKLTVAQCLRSRAPRCHPHLPRHNRRNPHSRAPHCRQQERPPRPHHHNRPRTPTSPKFDTRFCQDPADRRAVISPWQCDMLQ